MEQGGRRKEGSGNQTQHSYNPGSAPHVTMGKFPHLSKVQFLTSLMKPVVIYNSEWCEGSPR